MPPLAERVRQHAEEIAKDPSLQHEPPSPKAPPPPSNINIPIPPEIFLYLLVAVLAVALCIVAYHLYGTYAFGGRLSKKKVDQPLQVATQPIMRPAATRRFRTSTRSSAWREPAPLPRRST